MKNTEIIAKKQKTAFRLEYSVSTPIHAAADSIWNILTNAQDFSRWNSTVLKLEGEISQGQKIKLTSTLDPKRTFNLKVSQLQPRNMMVWSSGVAPMFKGERTYNLVPGQEGFIFSMSEVFSGVMLPVIAGSLPDFRESFEQFAMDLRVEAERG